MPTQPITRRTLLHRGAGLAGAAALAPFAGLLPAEAAQARRVKRVIIIRFGGGVRLSETFHHADPKSVIPNLVKLAGKGVLFTNVRNNGRLDHPGATGQLLTGRTYDPRAAIGKRLPHPTVFEYYRKAMGGAPAGSCLLLDPSWHPTTLEHSDHKSYGQAFAGVELLTRRIGVAQMNTVQAAAGNPKVQIWKDAEALKQLLLAESYEAFDTVNPKDSDPKIPDTGATSLRNNAFQREKVPRKIGKKAVASGDMLSVFLAKMAFKERKLDPAIMVINLHGSDVAHRGSYNGYLDAVRELDAVVGAFHSDAHEADNKKKKSTAIIITPDVGRDLDSGYGGGFAGHVSGDLGCRRLFALVLAPGLKARVVDRVVSQADICPTVGGWLGVPTPHVDEGAKAWPEVKA
jgi:hypothetical protein